VSAEDVLDVKLCGPVEIYRRFEGTCYVLQNRCHILRIWRQRDLGHFGIYSPECTVL